ncbi:MAG TPA: hypothetical protein VGQ08_12370 [Nitrospiraceae bacterium]|jgi:hypothetical protein|nr:hypothetical protein [Nitrospiraceae bacterium]
MIKPILFHDIDGVLFGYYDGEFQLRAGVKSWLRWAHEHFKIVWLTSRPAEHIITFLRVVYCEKFLKSSPAPPVQCADWSSYGSKVEWLSQAIPKLQGRQWYWIDDEVKYFEKEIKELNLPKDRCIQVSEKGAGALEELRDRLEKLRYDEGKKTLASR